MIVILSDGKNQEVGHRLYEMAQNNGAKATYVALENLYLLPCTACGSCSGKTFGYCVLEDEMQTILPLVANCRHWVLVSPIRFGSFSSRSKMVQERLGTLGDPRYYVKEDELVKGFGKGVSRYHAVGVKDRCSDQERDVFLKLHKENKQIMNCQGTAHVLSSYPEIEELITIVEAWIHG